jgi:hypothetical protein
VLSRPEGKPAFAPSILTRMPTILRSGPYRFFFYSNEGTEPAHVHVQRDRSLAKFWLRPVVLASSVGFSGKELREIEALVREHQEQFEEVLNDFFRSKR